MLNFTDYIRGRPVGEDSKLYSSFSVSDGKAQSFQIMTIN